MKCPKCQFESPEGMLFCGKCGTKLERICPKCNFPNPFDFMFCGKCATSLEQPKEIPPVDYDQPQSYTPQFLADKILTTRSSMEGERKLVTVLFADVANFTSISEKLDPEEVHQIMDRCFKILMDEIHKYEGTINQFTGDGVMALFGAPVAHEDHAQRACYAALSIQKSLEGYGQELQKKSGLEFKMRVGLNSGPVVVGSIGDDLRMDYTAVGDTTNLAARMESIARPGSISVSWDTYRLVRGFFEFVPLGRVKVKGKNGQQEAFELIRTGEVETRLEASIARGLTRFVGRKNSKAALTKALEKANAGSGQVVGIVGEAGVGKSRLLLEFRSHVLQSECTYLEGRCVHYGTTIPYLPILDALRSYFEIKEEEQASTIKRKMEKKVVELDKKLLGVLPSFQDLFSLKVEDEQYSKLTSKQKRERVFEALRNLFIRESQERELVIAVEDLHWIDKTTEEFLDYLIGWLPSTNILLILLYRPEYAHNWGSRSYYTKVGLDVLSTDSSSELVKAILKEGEVASELRQLIVNRAAGNPLFIEEFTYTLLENGSIEKKDEKYVLKGKTSDIKIPDTIQGIIAARMDRLELSLKQIMQMASVIGREFGFRILRAITDMKEDLKSNLLNLQGLEFIYEKSLSPELEFVFRHALIQEVAYDSLLQKRQKEIHEKIGRAIEELFPERLEEFYEMLGYHYSKSDHTDKAHQYLKLSGEKAINSHSTWEAFHSLDKAYHLVQTKPESEENLRERLELLHLILYPMLTAGYPEDSLQLLQDGVEISQMLNDTKSSAVFNSRMGRYYGLKEGNPLLGIKYSEKSFQEAEKINDVELVARTGFDLFPSYAISGQVAKIVEMSKKIIVLLEKSQNEHESFGSGWNIYSGVLSYCGWMMGWLGDFEKGMATLHKGHGFATHKITEPFALAYIEFSYGWLFNIRGDGKNAIEHLKKAIRQLEDQKIYSILGIAWNQMGWAHYLIGELETARRNIEKALSIQQDASMQFWMSLPFLLLSMIHSDSGKDHEALSCIEEAIILSQNNLEKGILGYSKIWHGRILGKVDQSQWGSAQEAISEGIGILEELQLKSWSTQGYLFLGELYVAIGQSEKAKENLEKAHNDFLEMGMEYWLAKTIEVMGSLI